MTNFPLWAAIRAVKEKIGTWVAYERMQDIAPEITREEWAGAIGNARAALQNRVDELTRPLNRRPTGPEEIRPYDSKKATGYMQQVEIYVRDQDTGLIDTRIFVVRTDTLRSRISVVNEAMDKYQAAIDANPSDYPEEILGVAYVGTHHLIPKG